MNRLPNDELVTAVDEILAERRVRTTRIGDGTGALVRVSDLVTQVRFRVGDEGDLTAKVHEAVKALGGQRRKSSIWGAVLRRRRFGEEERDVYVFPMKILPPPYDEPY
jgi:hypothetical protein